MAIKKLLRNAQHFREFQNDEVTGHRYHATCGETALATALVCASEPTESLAQTISLMESMTREMMGLHWADSPEGATTTSHLHDEAIRRGFTVASPYDAWEDPIPSSKLHPWLLQFAGEQPVVLMITNAGPALNAIDGSHDERGVQGHFICVVGLADEGYVCNDGDNDVITDHLVIYPWAAIEAAHVTGFLMIEMQGAQPVPVPANWKDANGVLTAPNGITVVKGFADYIRKNAWAEEDYPLEEEQAVASVEPLGNPAIGAGSRQIFRESMLGWTSATGSYKAWIGQELLAAYKKIADLEAAPAGDPAALDALKQQIADLTAQLAAANKQISDLTKTQVTPQIQADVDAVNALRDALRVQ
jgi:cell division protein FtsB